MRAGDHRDTGDIGPTVATIVPLGDRPVGVCNELPRQFKHVARTSNAARTWLVGECTAMSATVVEVHHQGFGHR